MARGSLVDTSHIDSGHITQCVVDLTIYLVESLVLFLKISIVFSNSYSFGRSDSFRINHIYLQKHFSVDF